VLASARLFSGKSGILNKWPRVTVDRTISHAALRAGDDSSWN